MTSLVGTTLKTQFYQYYLRQLIGSGAMADVYQAFDKIRATNMAVKVLRRDLAKNRRFYKAFEKEAGILSKLQHPNVVRLYEFGSDHGIVFIVMAWVDGTNLKEKIEQYNHPFSLGEVSSILSPIASALNFAHQMEIYHCDIKPSNILLSASGHEVLLTDFGVARLASERTGGGTVPYMAPEQFTSTTVGPRTDIYALGVTLYEMLSGGQIPFKGNPQSPGTTTREKIAWEHVNMPLPDLRNYNPSLPDKVVAVIEKSMDKNPHKRYATPMEFSGAFGDACRSTGQTIGAQKTILQPLPDVSPIQPTRWPQPSTGPKPKTRTISQTASPYLYGRSGERTGQTIPIPRNGLTIGRGSNNQLRLLERSVSRVHARIIWTQRTIYIRDKKSSLGTYLNGQRIPPEKSIPLRDGDVIQTGYYQVFEFRTR